MDFLDQIEAYFAPDSLPRIIESLSIVCEIFNDKKIELLVIDNLLIENFSEISDMGNFFKIRNELSFLVLTELDLTDRQFYSFKHPPHLIVPNTFYAITLTIIDLEENDHILSLIFPEKGNLEDLINHVAAQ